MKTAFDLATDFDVLKTAMGPDHAITALVAMIHADASVRAARIGARGAVKVALENAEGAARLMGVEPR